MKFCVEMTWCLTCVLTWHMTWRSVLTWHFSNFHFWVVLHLNYHICATFEDLYVTDCYKIVNTLVSVLIHAFVRTILLQMGLHQCTFLYSQCMYLRDLYNAIVCSFWSSHPGMKSTRAPSRRKLGILLDVAGGRPPLDDSCCPFGPKISKDRTAVTS